MNVIQKAAPEAYARRIKREGIVNAWDDKNFAHSVRQTGMDQCKHIFVTTLTREQARET
jgi:hypothetical protein